LEAKLKEVACQSQTKAEYLRSLKEFLKSRDEELLQYVDDVELVPSKGVIAFLLDHSQANEDAMESLRKNLKSLQEQLENERQKHERLLEDKNPPSQIPKPKTTPSKDHPTHPEDNISWEERCRRLEKENEELKAKLAGKVAKKDEPAKEVKAKEERENRKKAKEIKEDPLDQMVQALMDLYDFPEPIKRVSQGIYQVGSKKLQFQIQNGFLVVRVGGGFMRFEEWIKKWGLKEGIVVKMNEGVGVSVLAGKEVHMKSGGK
jgi:hypothetical protein